METDRDHATMRESFSLVQNILFIDYSVVLPAHIVDRLLREFRVSLSERGLIIVLPCQSLTSAFTPQMFCKPS